MFSIRLFLGSICWIVASSSQNNAEEWTRKTTKKLRTNLARYVVSEEPLILLIPEYLSEEDSNKLIDTRNRLYDLSRKEQPNIRWCLNGLASTHINERGESFESAQTASTPPRFEGASSDTRARLTSSRQTSSNVVADVHSANGERGVIENGGAEGTSQFIDIRARSSAADSSANAAEGEGERGGDTWCSSTASDADSVTETNERMLKMHGFDLKRAETETGSAVTCWGSSRTDTLRDVEERLERDFGLKLRHAAPAQLLHYPAVPLRSGTSIDPRLPEMNESEAHSASLGGYRAHLDCGGDLAGGAVKDENERIFSVLIYLNDVERGGETVFTRVNPHPLRVRPRRGTLLLWRSLDERLVCRNDTMHYASSVVARSSRSSIAMGKFAYQRWYHVHPNRYDDFFRKFAMLRERNGMRADRTAVCESYRKNGSSCREYVTIVPEDDSLMTRRPHKDNNRRNNEEQTNYYRHPAAVAGTTSAAHTKTSRTIGDVATFEKRDTIAASFTRATALDDERGMLEKKKRQSHWWAWTFRWIQAIRDAEASILDDRDDHLSVSTQILSSCASPIILVPDAWRLLTRSRPIVRALRKYDSGKPGSARSIVIVRLSESDDVKGASLGGLVIVAAQAAAKFSKHRHPSSATMRVVYDVGSDCNFARAVRAVWSRTLDKNPPYQALGMEVTCDDHHATKIPAPRGASVVILEDACATKIRSEHRMRRLLAVETSVEVVVSFHDHRLNSSNIVVTSTPITTSYRETVKSMKIDDGGGDEGICEEPAGDQELLTAPLFIYAKNISGETSA
eukprot:g2576.t1